MVTHLYDLAESLYEKDLGTALFLRAPRQVGRTNPSSSLKVHLKLPPMARTSTRVDIWQTPSGCTTEDGPQSSNGSSSGSNT